MIALAVMSIVGGVGGAGPAAAPQGGGSDGKQTNAPTVTIVQSGAFNGTTTIKPDPARRANLAAAVALAPPARAHAHARARAHARAHSGTANHAADSGLRRQHSPSSMLGGGMASSHPACPSGPGGPDPSMLYSNAHHPTTPLSAGGPIPASPPGMVPSMSPRWLSLQQSPLLGDTAGPGGRVPTPGSLPTIPPFGALTPPSLFLEAYAVSQTQQMPPGSGQQPAGPGPGPRPSQQQILRYKQMQLQLQLLQRQPQPVVDPDVARRFIQQQQHLHHQRRSQAHRRQLQLLQQRQHAALNVKQEHNPDEVNWESNQLENFFKNEVGILDLDESGPGSGFESVGSQSAPGSRRSSHDAGFDTRPGVGHARRVSDGGAFSSDFARRPSNDPDSFERRMSARSWADPWADPLTR